MPPGVGTMNSLAEQVAAELLKTDGLAAVWKLHMVAGRVHRDGYPREAERLLRIADAAEELVRRDLATRHIATRMPGRLPAPTPDGLRLAAVWQTSRCRRTAPGR
jgi:hypothetical protein